MNNDVGNRIKNWRKQSNLSVKDAISALRAEGVNISDKTLYGWESGHRQPDADTFLTLCKIYDVTSFLHDNRNNAPSISNEALQVARDYSDLDKPGRRAVRVTLDDQAQRVREQSKHIDKVTLFPVKEYIQSASAGYGDYVDDDSFDVIDLVKRPPAGTTYLIRVDGDSMEPTYHDGDRLFVSAQETLNFGDVGVFSINGDMYIKEYGREGLISHNPMYPIKRPSTYDTSIIIGRVLGVCTSDYLR